MRLAVSVQDGGLRAPAHAHRSLFVNDYAAIFNPVGMIAVRTNLPVVSSASGFHDVAKSLLHIARHFDFVVAPLPMEAEHGNTPLIDRVWIDLAVTLLV